jgi:hypothetical protein
VQRSGRQPPSLTRRRAMTRCRTGRRKAGSWPQGQRPGRGNLPGGRRLQPCPRPDHRSGMPPVMTWVVLTGKPVNPAAEDRGRRRFGRASPRRHELWLAEALTKRCHVTLVTDPCPGPETGGAEDTRPPRRVLHAGRLRGATKLYSRKLFLRLHATSWLQVRTPLTGAALSQP